MSPPFVLGAPLRSYTQDRQFAQRGWDGGFKANHLTQLLDGVSYSRTIEQCIERTVHPAFRGEKCVVRTTFTALTAYDAGEESTLLISEFGTQDVRKSTHLVSLDDLLYMNRYLTITSVASLNCAHGAHPYY